MSAGCKQYVGEFGICERHGYDFNNMTYDVQINSKSTESRMLFLKSFFSFFQTEPPQFHTCIKMSAYAYFIINDSPNPISNGTIFSYF